MALLDLSSVTETLTNLLETSVNALLARPGTNMTVWPEGATVHALAEPPDRLKNQGNVLGLYLYHVAEDAHYKNLPPPGVGEPPIRYSPMGLNLYYMLTAHSDQEDETGTKREQLLLGLAIKTLHDHPVVNDGADNCFRIVLQPVPADHAVTYWTAGSSPLRLAAYYEVSVVLLEPEKTTSRATRVLDYGVYAFVGGAPRLDGSRNTITFTRPGENVKREIELRPSQAPPSGAAPHPALEASRVTFLGSNLVGDRTELWLSNSGWDKPVKADASWSVEVQIDQLSAVVRETVGGKTVLPGIYGATAKVMRQRTMPGGQVREFEQSSNEMPFVITPRIDTVHLPVNAEVTITGYLFQHLLPDSVQVQVYIGEDRLMQGSAGALAAGQYMIANPTTLRLTFPAALESGKWFPLRILVNGAESAPRWIQKP